MATPIERLVVIERIIEKIPNRYEAVRVMAREARRLNSLVIRGAEADERFKPTSAAMDRLFEDKIRYEYVEREEPKELFAE